MHKKVKWDACVFAALLIVLVFTAKNDLDRFSSLQKERTSIEYRTVLETEKGKQLARQLKRRGSADQAELIARQKLGLVRRGETAYKILKDKQ